MIYVLGISKFLVLPWYVILLFLKWIFGERLYLVREIFKQTTGFYLCFYESEMTSLAVSEKLSALGESFQISCGWRPCVAAYCHSALHSTPKHGWCLLSAHPCGSVPSHQKESVNKCPVCPAFVGDCAVKAQREKYFYLIVFLWRTIQMILDVMHRIMKLHTRLQYIWFCLILQTPSEKLLPF